MNGLQLYTGVPTPRPNPGQDTPGRCPNLDYCSIGMQRVLVQVPLGRPFVCPECGGALRAPMLITGRKPSRLLPILRLTVFALGVTLALVVGYLLGRVQPAVQTAAHAVSKAAAVELTTAQTMLGLPPAAPAQQAPTPARPETARPPPTAPFMVTMRPYPTRLGPVDATTPPAHLLHEARFGQVTIDCTLPAGQTHPTCRIADIRGADSFPPAALAGLQALTILYEQDHAQKSPAGADHRWRVVLDDFSGTAKATADR